MNIIKTENAGTVTLKPEGWLDTVSSPELGEAIDSITAADAIVIDLDAVEYIASSGLRQIVACHRRAKELGAKLTVINACAETMSIFTLTGLDKKLDIKAK